MRGGGCVNGNTGKRSGNSSEWEYEFNVLASLALCKFVGDHQPHRKADAVGSDDEDEDIIHMPSGWGKAMAFQDLRNARRLDAWASIEENLIHAAVPLADADDTC